MHWLVTNANLDDDDITFLHKAESDTHKKLVCSLQEEATQRSNFDEHEETAWYGAKPWLRLYSCIIEDEIKAKYL